MEYKDYYQILGVSKSAEAGELKKAYKKLARKYHPDVSKEADAEDKFKDVGEAYDTLKDPEKRAQYDRFGSNYKHGQSFNPPPGSEGADFGSFFDNMFAGGGGFGGFGGGQQQAPPGKDIQARLRISLEEAFSGTTKSIRRPKATGKSGELTVKIPAGIVTGKKIRLTGQGEAGMSGQAGDLYLEITVSPHSHYQLEGKDILLDLPLTPWEAALGTKVTVPTLAGKINLAIPAGAQSGKKMRLKGRGLPGKTPGDQFVVLQIITPPAETDEAKAFYEKMAETMDFDPRTDLNSL